MTGEGVQALLEGMWKPIVVARERAAHDRELALPHADDRTVANTRRGEVPGTLDDGD